VAALSLVLTLVQALLQTQARARVQKRKKLKTSPDTKTVKNHRAPGPVAKRNPPDPLLVAGATSTPAEKRNPPDPLLVAGAASTPADNGSLSVNPTVYSTLKTLHC
jgi:hypothetical protein